MRKFWSLLSVINHKKTNLNIRLLSKIDNFGFLTSKKTQNIRTKKIFYSVCLWGEEYIKIFNEILIPSLLQKENIPNLKKFGCYQKIFIFTKDNEYPLYKKNELLLNRYLSIEIVKNPNVSNNLNPKKFLKNSLVTFIKKSILSNAYSMVLTPDHVYGNKSIFNLFVSVYGKDYGIACVGARINWKSSHTKLKKYFNKNKVLNNPNLVKFTFENLHPAFKQCINAQSNYLGLTLEAIDKNKYLVCSSRVNVCIVKFKKSDLKFFNSIEDYNNIDFYWPRLLIKEGRYKFIGDSDYIFYSELTKEDLKIEKFDKSLLNYTLYGKNRRLINHVLNDSYYSIWKINK